MPFQIIVERERCSGCEACLEVCSFQVFKIHEGKSVPARNEDCVGCRSCEEICKEQAITVREVQAELSETARTLLRNLFND